MRNDLFCFSSLLSHYYYSIWLLVSNTFLFERECGSTFVSQIRLWHFYRATLRISHRKVFPTLALVFIIVGPYVFRVAKSMSKLDIKEYLTKIYNVRVVRVNTANVLGKMNRDIPLYYLIFRKGLSIHSFDHPKGA